MTDESLDDYTQPGPTTDLGGYVDLVRPLPSEPEELARIVRGLVLHEGLVAPAGLVLAPERLADRERVGAAAILRRVLDLDALPLVSQRPPADRMVGYCYHFAVLHCAFLRAKGLPSRSRCGFAGYYREDAWIDHWVVEYWKDDGWVIIDPDSGRDVVSPDEFHHAGLAWRLCRAGTEDPLRHGNHVLWGWDELRGSLVSDIAALNKIEVGEWESWCDLIGIENKAEANHELDACLDPLAEMVSNDDALEDLQHKFAHEKALQPPVPSL